MDRRTREYEQPLEDYQPNDRHGTHEIERSLEPDYRWHSGGILREDAFVVEENREFDRGDCGAVEVFEEVQDEVPLFHRIGAGDFDMFTEAFVDSWFIKRVNWSCRWKRKIKLAYL